MKQNWDFMNAGRITPARLSPVNESVSEPQPQSRLARLKKSVGPGFITASNPRRVEKILQEVESLSRRDLEDAYIKLTAEKIRLISAKHEGDDARRRVEGLECAVNREKARADAAEAKLRSLGIDGI